jgi:hypothetical protein
MSIKRLIEREEENIISAVEGMRRYMDAIQHAIAQNERVPASISGDPFFTTAARELEQACIKRQAYYDADAHTDRAEAAARRAAELGIDLLDVAKNAGRQS